MVKLLYRDFPKMIAYYRDYVWVIHVGPDFTTWVRDEFNCQVEHNPWSWPQHDWYLEFINDADATAFVLKWG